MAYYQAKLVKEFPGNMTAWESSWTREYWFNWDPKGPDGEVTVTKVKDGFVDTFGGWGTTVLSRKDARLLYQTLVAQGFKRC